MATIGCTKTGNTDAAKNEDSSPVMKYRWDAHQCADTYIIDWCESHKHECKQGADFHDMPLKKQFEKTCKAELSKIPLKLGGISFAASQIMDHRPEREALEQLLTVAVRTKEPRASAVSVSFDRQFAIYSVGDVYH